MSQLQPGTVAYWKEATINTMEHIKMNKLFTKIRLPDAATLKEYVNKTAPELMLLTNRVPTKFPCEVQVFVTLVSEHRTLYPDDRIMDTTGLTTESFMKDFVEATAQKPKNAAGFRYMRLVSPTDKVDEIMKAMDKQYGASVTMSQPPTSKEPKTTWYLCIISQEAEGKIKR